ncbi:MAG: c-type cytochrome biogenesis protein CcmF [Gammaproteobacteria bacterium]|nr:c-type cytochrome biogenesis protein CcmF [Gammaproteobacteria bacterium]|tara:strand:+ start:2744 stop:4678 length:1935 start_codon:yes stop_codon:yes gene_type:complete
MIPELGQFSLIIAFFLSLIMATYPIAGSLLEKKALLLYSRPMAIGQFFFIMVSFLSLATSFLTNDFTVLYVTSNSNTSLPFFYKFAAIWGGHEGSLLLWITILSVWTLMVSLFTKKLPERYLCLVLGVLGIIISSLLIFTLLTSNPFERLLIPVSNGNDLNPLLQDPAMVMHPPILYIGYVGFSVPFAFAVAALLGGKFEKDWARWMTPWTVASWVFLTLGITLGSWWAYYELGWGGWWFWDPVENASFMPWLAGTALIHSLQVTRSRGLFKSWTILLAILAFSLSLLGTFLVRSGILISVHAFASDPSRGIFILVLLSLISGGALFLYAFRARVIQDDGSFNLVSRESFLLINNILLIISVFVILLGTLYPLFLDALGMGKISVGPPYFNLVFIIPMIPLSIFLGIGMHTVWKKTSIIKLINKLSFVAISSVIFGYLILEFTFGVASFLSLVGFIVGLWVILSSLLKPVEYLFDDSLRISNFTNKLLGMTISHLGMGVFIIGVTITSTYNIEVDRSARVGDSWEVGNYSFTFDDLRQVDGPNYQAQEASISVFENNKFLTQLLPQKRIYSVQQNPMTEASIDNRLSRDIFVALGEPLGDGSWSLRIQIKPLIRFIWLGAIIMALGGLVSISRSLFKNNKVTYD